MNETLSNVPVEYLGRTLQVPVDVPLTVQAVWERILAPVGLEGGTIALGAMRAIQQNTDNERVKGLTIVKGLKP